MREQSTAGRMIEDAIAESSRNGGPIAAQITTDPDSRGDSTADTIVDITMADGVIVRVSIERIVGPTAPGDGGEGPYTREQEQAMSADAITTIMARIAPNRERDADIIAVEDEEASMIVVAPNGVAVGVALSVDWP